MFKNKQFIKQPALTILYVVRKIKNITIEPKTNTLQVQSGYTSETPEIMMCLIEREKIILERNLYFFCGIIFFLFYFNSKICFLFSSSKSITSKNIFHLNQKYIISGMPEEEQTTQGNAKVNKGIYIWKNHIL